MTSPTEPSAPPETPQTRPADPAQVPGTPLTPAPRQLRAPDWLQVFIIVALLAAALFMALEHRYLWSVLLAVAGLAFGASFILRRMVGDQYGRS